MKKILLMFIILLFSCSVVWAIEDVVKEDTDEWFMVILVDDTDGKTAETGKTSADTNVQYCAEGGTSWTAYTDDASTWKEVGNGVYWLQMGASEFSDNKKYAVTITVSGCRTYRISVNATDNSLNDSMLAASDINAEVSDVLKTDTISEGTEKADFPATPTFEQAVKLQYMINRNKIQTTADEYRITNDAGTVILERDLSDTGTVFEKGEIRDDD